MHELRKQRVDIHIKCSGRATPPSVNSCPPEPAYAASRYTAISKVSPMVEPVRASVMIGSVYKGDPSRWVRFAGRSRACRTLATEGSGVKLVL